MKKADLVGTRIFLRSLQVLLNRLSLLTVIALATMAALRPAHAQAGAEAWVQRYNRPGASGDEAQKIVVDSSGNLIVVT